MKSYSDDIPNVSSTEMQRTIQIADETNELVRDNLDEIMYIQNRLRYCVILTGINIVLSSATLATVIFLIAK